MVPRITRIEWAVQGPSDNRPNWAVLRSAPNTRPSLYSIFELHVSCLYITTSWGSE